MMSRGWCNKEGSPKKRKMWVEHNILSLEKRGEREKSSIKVCQVWSSNKKYWQGTCCFTDVGLKLSKAKLYLEKTGCLSQIQYLLSSGTNFWCRWQIGCLHCTCHWSIPYSGPINKPMYATHLCHMTEIHEIHELVCILLLLTKVSHACGWRLGWFRKTKIQWHKHHIRHNPKFLSFWLATHIYIYHHNGWLGACV